MSFRTPYDAEPNEDWDCAYCGDPVESQEAKHIASPSKQLCNKCSHAMLTDDIGLLDSAIDSLGWGIHGLMDSDIPEHAHFALEIKVQLDKIHADLVAYRDMVKAKLEKL